MSGGGRWGDGDPTADLIHDVAKRKVWESWLFPMQCVNSLQANTIRYYNHLYVSLCDFHTKDAVATVEWLYEW